MRDYPVFCVAPAKGGELFLSPAQTKLMTAYLQRHDGQHVRMTLSQPTKARSHSQNRYYWGVVLLHLADETGHTTEEVHEFMKAMFLPRSFIKIGKTIEQLTKSTTTLSTAEFEDYLENVRAFAATELSLHIPLPHET